MENDPYPQGTYAAAAPPTMPGPLPAAAPATRWQVVLGVIGILFGIGGAIGGVWGIVGMEVMSKFVPNMPREALAQIAAGRLPRRC
ncbi:MAG: hypothetical protein HY718_05230 [Planctomycetes bacterium]|nr:hypothetical protein [Planctomycetota bacterium]